MFNVVEQIPNTQELVTSVGTSGGTTGAKPKYNSLLNILQKPMELTNDNVDKMLEQEKINNKTESWNKLDRTLKIQRLHYFAEKYGRDNNLPVKDIKSLKTFFVDCLEKGKLQKTKDIQYNKETQEIISIPALQFNTTTRNFTLKIMDTKRVSTLKSLTPKRISIVEDNVVSETKN